MSIKKAPRGIKKACANIIQATGLKKDGTLKKGFKYQKGGKIVAVKKAVAPAKKKK